MQTKKIVFYHKNCFDGLAAATVFHSQRLRNPKSRNGVLSGSEPRYFAYEYGDNLADLVGFHEPEGFAETDVLLLDITFDDHVLLAIAEHASSVTVIDHHPKAIQQSQNSELSRKVKFVIPTEEEPLSGVQLTWRYCTPGIEEPASVRWVGKRDRWVFDESEIRPFSLGLGLLGTDLERWFKEFPLRKGYRTDSQGCLELLVNQGRSIEQYRNQQLDYLVENCTYRGRVSGYYVTFVNAPKFLASEVAERLYNKLTLDESPFVVVVYIEHGKQCFSLRSHKDSTVNLTQIAEENGGGGHFHAAGFKRPISDSLINP